MTQTTLPEILNTKLTASEAAKFLKCSISFIRTETKKGNLAHFKMGNRFYYHPDDLINLIKRIEPHTNDSDIIE